MTASERNLYILGNLWAMADSAAPSLRYHFHKLFCRPQILLATMSKDKRIRQAWDLRLDLMSELSVGEGLPSIASPEQVGMILMGYHHHAYLG